MMNILRTNSTHPGFVQLVQQLDAYLHEIDGAEHAFYAQFNTIDYLKEVVLIFEDDLPIACGAFRPLDASTVEIKRMFTLPGHRKNGVATQVLRELELWAAECGFSECVLETGKRMSDAVQFYLKNGYEIIPNYGQYVAVENSICFKKKVTPAT